MDLFFLQRSKLSLERFSISELITILNYFHINQVNFRSSGVLKPHEMCLVLGCPGSGCSTFLKTIADQRDGYLNVNHALAPTTVFICLRTAIVHYRPLALSTELQRNPSVSCLHRAMNLIYSLLTRI